MKILKSLLGFEHYNYIDELDNARRDIVDSQNNKDISDVNTV